MSKKITIVATPNAKNDFKTVTVQIVEQTHRGSEFTFASGNTFKAKNGVKICSNYNLYYSEVDNALYVRGANYGHDNLSAEIPANDFGKIKEAIDEYNEVHKVEMVKIPAKVLKFSATPNAENNYNTVKIQIVEQTHRGNEFSHTGSSFVSSAGFELRASGIHPCNSICSGKVYVMGLRNSHLDNSTFELTVEKYGKFKAAVEEYNKVHAEKLVPAKKKQLLEISATPNAKTDFKTVTVMVTKQTFAGENFGNKGEFLHGKLRLASCPSDKAGFSSFLQKRNLRDNPELMGTFYVAGKPTSDRSCLTADVTVEVYGMLKAAVEAFNKEFN